MQKLQRKVLDKEQVKDVKNIAHDVYYPLTGFLGEKDMLSVLSRMRLADGRVWPIPIVLDLDEQEYSKFRDEDEILLKDTSGQDIALLKNIEIFTYNKDYFAESIFGTLDTNHPGVENVYQMGDYLIGGDIEIIDDSKEIFPEYNFTPSETRKIFKERGWETVVAFQTRNIPHRGHEFLQKYTLEEEGIDGLFIQPVIGEKKVEDFKDEYILATYETLIDKYYPKDKVLLGILPLKMRYAGPREAVFHALIRKNFGCTHFIVGRDHAGVGDYYPPTAAQDIFDKFDKEEIGIEILKYSEVVYRKTTKTYTFVTQCPEEEKISFSGTRLREKIKNKRLPPSYLIRPEVYYLLSNSYNPLVDNMTYNQDKAEANKSSFDNKKENVDSVSSPQEESELTQEDSFPQKGSVSSKNQKQKGFVLWFTGLSQAGKTTLADKVYKRLEKRGLRIERLDGDIVREYLSKDLGFSKEDRDENIRRIGFVATLLSKNGVGVVTSFISPYKKQRGGVREKVEPYAQFIEVFCNCPLETCEKRDKKGLYQKARKGEIENFTGISDPYEEPDNPELELFTGENKIEDCVEEVIAYLEKNNLIPKSKS